MNTYDSIINHIKRNVEFYIEHTRDTGSKEVTLYGLDKIMVLTEEDKRAIETRVKVMTINRKKIDDAFFLRNQEGQLGLVVSW